MRRQKGRGFVLIELMLVLIVIAILAGSYFSQNRSANSEQGIYQISMNRSKDVACKANRAALMNTIQMFKMSHPTEAVTSENMQKAGYSIPTCPNGGAYGFTKDGKLLCSKHPEQGQ